MTRYYSSTEVVALINDLTEPRLTAFLRFELNDPQHKHWFATFK